MATIVKKYEESSINNQELKCERDDDAKFPLEVKLKEYKDEKQININEFLKVQMKCNVPPQKTDDIKENSTEMNKNTPENVDIEKCTMEIELKNTDNSFTTEIKIILVTIKLQKNLQNQ